MREDKDWLHMHWAANDWEHEQGVIDQAGEENRRKLARHPELSAAVAATLHQQLCLRIDHYLKSGVPLCSLQDRIAAVVKLFRMVRYNEWYAGHEGPIRQLIWRVAGKPWGIDLDEDSLGGSERVRLLVAYYLAFTDWALETEIGEGQTMVEDLLARIRAGGSKENSANEELLQKNSHRLSSEELVSLFDDKSLDLGLRHAAFVHLWDRPDLPDSKVLPMARAYLDGLLVFLASVGLGKAEGGFRWADSFAFFPAHRLAVCEQRSDHDEKRIIAVFRWHNRRDDPAPVKVQAWLETQARYAGPLGKPLQRCGLPEETPETTEDLLEELAAGGWWGKPT